MLKIKLLFETEEDLGAMVEILSRYTRANERIDTGEDEDGRPHLILLARENHLAKLLLVIEYEEIIDEFQFIDKTGTRTIGFDTDEYRNLLRKYERLEVA